MFNFLPTSVKTNLIYGDVYGRLQVIGFDEKYYYKKFCMLFRYSFQDGSFFLKEIILMNKNITIDIHSFVIEAYGNTCIHQASVDEIRDIINNFESRVAEIEKDELEKEQMRKELEQEK